MAPSLTASFRALWHELTSNDRHATHNSPYRTGSHVPLAQNKHSPMTSMTGVAIESRTDLSGHDLESGNNFVNGNSNGSQTGVRRQSSNLDSKNSDATMGEIQMQNFSDGLPPPPPVAHSWKRIDRWLEDNYEELFENVGEGATINDINDLEHELDCTLPNEVRDSLQIHDGQERGGMPTGVIFGCMLLDCEEIIHEWQNWRTVNEVYFGDTQNYEIPKAPIKAFAGSSTIPVAQSTHSNDPQWRQGLLDRQDSQPPNAVQKVYAHPSWIPLARDWGGNNICVDLAPGPAGRWGQVILMGRDYDCKYVISRSWSAFLATVADDMNTDKWFIDEDTKELKLREFRQPGVEPAYIDILRWRSDQKYGRKGPKRRQLRVNSSGAAPSANGFSPYGSPTTEDRGRSPHRLSNGKAPATSSPRAHMSSPLARVAEESTPSQSLKVDTSVSERARSYEKLIPADTPRMTNSTKPEKLVPVDTPQLTSLDDSERKAFSKTGLGETASGSEATDVAPTGADEMKDVQI